MIGALPHPLQDEVREVFAHGIDIFWRILLAFCAVGLLSVFFQKEIPLHMQMDRKWALEGEQDNFNDEELVTGSLRPLNNGKQHMDVEP